MTHCFESNAFYYITIRHRNDLLTCLTSFHLYQMFEVAFLKDEKTLLVSLKKKNRWFYSLGTMRPKNKNLKAVTF